MTVLVTVIYSYFAIASEKQQVAGCYVVCCVRKGTMAAVEGKSQPNLSIISEENGDGQWFD